MIKKAHALDDFIVSFGTEPLEGESLKQFYCDQTLPVRYNYESKYSPLVELREACAVPNSKNAHLLI